MIQQIVVIFILFISSTQAREHGKKLQAMSYCCLPASNTTNTTSEYEQLARLMKFQSERASM